MLNLVLSSLLYNSVSERFTSSIFNTKYFTTAETQPLLRCVDWDL